MGSAIYYLFEQEKSLYLSWPCVLFCKMRWLHRCSQGPVELQHCTKLIIVRKLSVPYFVPASCVFTQALCSHLLLQQTCPSMACAGLRERFCLGRDIVWHGFSLEITQYQLVLIQLQYELVIFIFFQLITFFFFQVKKVMDRGS